jgi:hypothetical protein
VSAPSATGDSQSPDSAPAAARSRTGKIARLPRVVRDALNQRLDDGCAGPAILVWLHSLPEVRSLLRQHFGGRSISPQNLSEWRLGGFADWQRARERHAVLAILFEHLADCEHLASGGALADRLAPLTVVALAAQLQAALSEPDSPAKARALVTLSREFDRVRRSDRAARQDDREHTDWRREQPALDRAAEDRRRQAEAEHILTPLKALRENRSLLLCYRVGENDRVALDCIWRAASASVGLADFSPPTPAKSEPIKPDPT